MLYVLKRDGQPEEFDLAKIESAMEKAFIATKTPYTGGIVMKLALCVSAAIKDKVCDGVVDIEDIQDAVETVLSETGYANVAKSYILYRKQREQLRKAKGNMNAFSEVVEDYLRVSQGQEPNQNASITKSVGGLILANSEVIVKDYWLSKVYDQEISTAHKNGDFHIHDLGFLGPYCAGWSLKQLIKEGLGGVPGKISSAPASHLNSLINQMVNFLGILQLEWAGAQAFSSFDTYLAPFVRVDNLSYKEVKQSIQNFVFGVNVPSRWGSQAPFSNITLDWVVPNDLAELPAIVGGKEMDFCYKDCKKEMDMVNKAFLEVMIEGDANGRGFSYPINFCGFAA